MSPMLRWARLRHFARIQTGITIDASRDQGDGAEERPYLRVANVQAGRLDLDEVKTVSVPPFLADRATLKPGDVLMTEGGDLDKLGRGTVWHGQVPGCLHQNHIFAVRPHPGRLDSDYLAQFTQTSHARSYFESTGVKTTNLASTSSSKILDLPIPVLPIECQRAIVDFLDRETALIDALITAKRRMIELVGELLAASVRERLNQGFPLTPLKRRWELLDCKHRTPIYVDAGYPVVSPGDTVPGRLDLSRCHRFVGEEEFNDLTDDGRRPKRGDIVYSRNASIGIASFVDSDTPFCMGQDVCLITSGEQDQRYLTYALNVLGKAQLDQRKVGSTFSRINMAQIGELLVPCPSPPLQRQIADELDHLSEEHGLLEALLARQINLLAERRQALITAAVTGEIEIPGAAA